MNSISIKNIKDSNPKKVKDVWNAFMAEGAVFGNYDIPYCPTTAITIPTACKIPITLFPIF